MLQTELSAGEFEAKNIERCTFASEVYVKTDNGIAVTADAVFTGFEQSPDTYILTLDEYNRVSGTQATLEEGEILLYASDGFYQKDTLTFGENTYTIKGEADTTCLKYIQISSMALFSKLLIVVENEAVRDLFIGGDVNSIVTWVGFDFDTNHSIEQAVEFAERLNESFAVRGVQSQAMFKHVEQEGFYSMYGGILFVGVILGVLFILCTVMIIYYKQISEGFEDRERFQIMQRVGLTKEEIKKVIHSQVMLVFFLPLGTAIIHAAAASGIVAKCLKMVVIVHMPTFIVSTVVTCVVFAVVYAVVYKITSKEYYAIVNG